MICVNPYRPGHGEFGCGACMPCRINKRRGVTARLVLESLCYPWSAFATLTFKDDPGTVARSDLTAFGKSLVRLRGPTRYYGVGEYGDRFGRPHYHVALFGVSVAELELVSKAWSRGGVHLGELNHDTAQYLGGYICKKLVKKEVLGDRHPEFAQMSRRPGIGDPAAEIIARSLSTPAGCKLIELTGDVPCQIRVSGKLYPLDNFMRKKIRVAYGWPPNQPQLVAQMRRSAYLAEPLEIKVERDVKRVHSYNSAVRRVEIKGSTRKL